MSVGELNFRIICFQVDMHIDYRQTLEERKHRPCSREIHHKDYVSVYYFHDQSVKRAYTFSFFHSFVLTGVKHSEPSRGTKG
jgi:hypothetical protein